MDLLRNLKNAVCATYRNSKKGFMWKRKKDPLKWEMALLNEAWQFVPKDPTLHNKFEINITRADVKVLFSFEDAFARVA